MMVTRLKSTHFNSTDRDSTQMDTTTTVRFRQACQIACSYTTPWCCKCGSARASITHDSTKHNDCCVALEAFTLT